MEKFKRQVDVMDFLDVHQFLQSYYQNRKAATPEFSYHQWAEEIGFNNRSFLRMITSGKRKVSEGNKKAFLENMGFEPLQKLYFVSLVDLSNCSTSKEKLSHSQQLIKLQRLRSERVTVNDPKGFLSHPKIPGLHVLLGFEKVKKDLPTLSHILNEPAEQITEWLGLLKDLDLVEGENGNWKSKASSFKVPDSKGNAALRSFHQMCMERALTALSLPSERRKFRSLYLPLDADGLARLWKKFDEFILQMLAEYEGVPLDSREIYQLNLNFVPLSLKETFSGKEEIAPVEL